MTKEEFCTMDAAELEAKMAKSRPWIHYPDPVVALGLHQPHPGTTLALILFGEARGEGYLGQVLVAQVILNRLNDPHKRRLFGHRKTRENTIQFVVAERWQFSCVNDDNYPRLLRSWKNDVRAWEQCKAAAFDVLEGRQRIDLTEGATHYHTVDKPAYAKVWPPKWAESPRMVRTIQYRKHIFYREEP